MSSQSGFCYSVPCDPADDSGEDAPPTRQQKTGKKGGKKRAAGYPAAAHAQPGAGQQHAQLQRQQQRQKIKTLQAQPLHEQHAAAAEAAGFDYDAARSAAPGLDLRMSAGAAPANPEDVVLSSHVGVFASVPDDSAGRVSLWDLCSMDVDA